MDNYKTLEYLEPQADGTFKYIESGNPTNGNQLIEIPDGAEIAYYFGAEYNHISFYKKIGKTVFVISPNYKDWKETSYKSIDEVPYNYANGFIVWERNKQIEKDPALISGAEAELVAQAKKHIDEDHITRFEAATAFLCGEKVQFMLANGDFIDINSDTTLGIFEEDGGYSFRLKPKFITINGIEVPAPMERDVEKGETAWLIGEPLTDNFDGYFSTSAMCYSENYAFGWWNKEEKVKQVAAALRTILGGTNS